MTGFDDGDGGLEDVMGGLRREVEAAVRVPPYEVVVRRHQRRRRRRAGIGGLALAAVAAISVVVVPSLAGPRTGAVAPTSRVTVNTPRIAAAGTVTLDDVSFGDTSDGTLLGRRCAASCSDVVLTSTDGGRRYGSPVDIPGLHRYVAAGGGVRIAYAPDLTVSTDGGGDWTAIDAPAPVADVSVSGGRILVLLVPAGAPAELWSGPVAATDWSDYTEVAPGLTGTDDTARLLRTGDAIVVVDNRGAPFAEVGTLAGGRVASWTRRDLAPCSAGSQASVSAVSALVWWVTCRGETGSRGGQEVALTGDGGLSYTGTTAAVPDASLQQVVTALTPEVAYLSGGPALLVTTNGGGSWSTAFTTPGLGVPHIPAGSGGRDIWVLAPGSPVIWRSATGGDPWQGVTIR